MVPASGGLGEDHAFSRHGPILSSHFIVSRVPRRSRAEHVLGIPRTSSHFLPLTRSESAVACRKKRPRGLRGARHACR